ncbi:hypothetical protein [Arthrobacter sp. TMS2-4]
MRNPGHLPTTARRSDLRVAYLLTVLAAITMASSSAGGVLATDWLYRDNDLITATFRGQDMVTLVVAVPLLLLGLVLEVRGSPRGRMLWLGMLFYTMYAYLFYAVAAAFNQFFLLYVASFGLPLYALLLSVTRLDLRRLGEGMGGTAARAVAIAYTSAVAAGPGILWCGMSLSYLATGEVPQPILDSGHPTGVVFVIDLVFIVPPMLLAAVWLARRRASGWVLAGVMSVGGTVYTLTLAAASVEVARQGVGSGAELPLWAGLTVLGAATALLLFRCMPRSCATPAREGEDADDRQGDAGHGRRRSARLVGRDA